MAGSAAPVSRPSAEAGLPGRYRIVAMILAAQTMANVGPLGIPAIASLIREDLGLTLPQVGLPFGGALGSRA